MNRKLLIVLLSLLAVVGDMWGQPLQALQLEHRQRSEQLLQLKCAEFDVDSVPIVAAWTYDIVSQELVLEIILRRIDYDHVWFPLRHYDRMEVVDYTRQESNWFTRLFQAWQPWKKPFRRKMDFGLDCVFRCSNCEFLNDGTSSVEQEMIANGDFATYRFRVSDPDKPVRITLKGAVPVSLVETASGHKKYRYQYISDPIRIELEIPSDPCILPQNVSIQNEIRTLYRQIENEYNSLKGKYGKIKNPTENKKVCEQCLQERAAIENNHRDQYDNMSRRYYGMSPRCDGAQGALDSINHILRDAASFECPRYGKGGGKGTTIVIPTTIDTITIMRKTADLDIITSELREAQLDKRPTSGIIAKGQKLINETDKIISEAQKITKLDENSRNAIKNYEIVKETFNLNK